MLNGFHGMDVDSRLERACDHVSEFWFPVNSALLKRIRTGLSSGAYDSNVIQLLNEIRSDFALYAYCIKELLSLLASERVSAPSDCTPSQLLEWAGVPRIRKILGAESKSISKHSLNQINPAQADRYFEAVTSAAASELLAESSGVDGDLGYSAALLRQLAYLLIAWNYPRVYEKAIAGAKSSTDLDRNLEQILGFPPRALGAKLARRWGLAEHFCSVLTELDAEQPRATMLSPEEIGERETLTRICQIGEALARANNPETYPRSAAEDWNTAKAEIESLLGNDGLKQIHERLTENAKEFSLSAPKGLNFERPIDPEGNIAAFQEGWIERRNPYVKGCQKEFRSRLEAFYLGLGSTGDVKERLRAFLKDVLPSSGYAGGCIFTVDNYAEMLVPRTKFGELRSDIVRHLPYRPYTPESDIINAAFQSQDPVIIEQRMKDGTPMMCVSGMIGQIDTWIGVLYLEMPKILFEESYDDYTKHFQAAAQAITSCIHTE